MKHRLLQMLLGLWCGALPACRTATPPAPGIAVARGWGIDAVLTGHVSAVERPAYVTLLKESGIGFLRERGPSPEMQPLQEAGFHVVSFLGLSGVSAQLPGNQLAEDLLAVHRAAAEMARKYPTVEAWEMVGEPDVGYARDLPDRVAAFQKAVYLGIHSVNSRSQNDSVVLMGALALPPGPWLERAARNGLLDYTDAYNFHFYGHAEDLTGVINAHRAFIARWAEVGLAYGGQVETTLPADHPGIGSSALRQAQGKAAALLPLWITEAGLNAVKPDDFLNPERRKLQADFTISTARQALAAPDVAMFMPFILVHKDDPFAMTILTEGRGRGTEDGGRGTGDGGQRTEDGGRRAEDGGLALAPSPRASAAHMTRLPAWEAYAKFTREHPWPLRPLARVPHEPNPVVVQWLPDPATSVTHKVSGTYRFQGGAIMRGEIRIYNLGATAVRGRLTAPAPTHAQVEGLAVLADGRLGSAEIEIPALGRATIPVAITPTAAGYFREDWEPVFAGSDGKTSSVFFGLERVPEDRDFRAEPLPLQALPGRRIPFPEFAEYRAGETAGPWTTMNGLRVEAMPEAKAAPGGNPAARFRTDAVENDPLRPPMAVARLEGLPADGFIRMHLDRPMDRNTQVRVDLVDDDGQRFCIWENLGRSYSRPWEDVWLNLHDFGMYIWSRATSHPVFRPERVREIQLRFYFAQANDPIGVEFALMRPR